MIYLLFVMILFIFIFNVLQLIVYYDSFKTSIIRKFYVKDNNVEYRNKKYKIRK